jgi:hypothetical protein
MRTSLVHRWAAGVLICPLFAACGGEDSPVVPSTGSIRVTVSVTGVDLPRDYLVVVESRSVLVNAQALAVIAGLAPGAHSVLLRVASNCQVDGENPRPTSVVAGDTAAVAFSVTCAATTGTLVVTTTTTGADLDQTGYVLRVAVVGILGGSFTTSRRIVTTGTETITGVPAGVSAVTLTEVALNCDPVDANPRTVSLAPGGTTALTFTIECAPATDQLAYVVGSGAARDIYVANVNGTGVRRVTTDPGAEDDPAWSPDGNKIAFTSDRDGNREIYVTSADGTNPVRLTNDPAADYHPAWSPDGARIAFVSDRMPTAGGIFVMNADGTNPVPLATGDNATDPAWSPDGRSIAFASERGGKFDIYLVNVDGGVPTRLTADGGRYPAWSRDGTALAYSAPLCGYYACYQAIYIKVGAETRIISSVGERPAWHRGGRKIAYNGFNCDYYFVKCDPGGVLVTRTDWPEVVFAVSGQNPVWRP